MTLAHLINNYQHLNNSFEKKFIFHLGCNAGFFSEYNNMILAMLYCLKHEVKFTLYSKDANFGTGKGWQDYFLPFCEESTNLLHSKFNSRMPDNNTTLSQNLGKYFLKILTNTNYITSDLWNEFHNKKFEEEIFKISQLDIYGKTQDACSKLIEMTWRYNSFTNEKIEKLIRSISLPSQYIGFHIRGGDKIIEYPKVEASKYFEVAQQNSNLKDVFVLTDDYRIIIELNQNYPTWNFYTLCGESENGYFHNHFSAINHETKKNHMIKLFASIDILSKSQHFIGTFSSNPGMYLGMRMNSTNIHGVDFDKWTIW